MWDAGGARCSDTVGAASAGVVRTAVSGAQEARGMAQTEVALAAASAGAHPEG